MFCCCSDTTRGPGPQAALTHYSDALDTNTLLPYGNNHRNTNTPLTAAAASAATAAIAYSVVAAVAPQGAQARKQH
jgi:hypothetical protein